MLRTIRKEDLDPELRAEGVQNRVDDLKETLNSAGPNMGPKERQRIMQEIKDLLRGNL